jgi:hypothetical protein
MVLVLCRSPASFLRVPAALAGAQLSQHRMAACILLVHTGGWDRCSGLQPSVHVNSGPYASPARYGCALLSSSGSDADPPQQVLCL